MDTKPIERRTFDPNVLMAEGPPGLSNKNKRLVFDIACPPGTQHKGEIGYTRWDGMPLPELISPAGVGGRVEIRQDVYDYFGCADLPGATEWHVNFADPNLFVAYDSGLFAQDEMQVAEHPVLGALREALLAMGSTVRTVEQGSATPIVIKGVERRCRVETNANAAAGRPHGLYGNEFAAAPPEVVQRATHRLDPPTTTNLVAIAAPRPGWGDYEVAEIEDALVTAYTGFRAAVSESRGTAVVVHTGHWGCGAFGGNRILMALIQTFAAHMAGVERLFFHTFDASGAVAVESALRLVAAFGTNPIRSSEFVNQLAARRFQWGVSDGN